MSDNVYSGGAVEVLAEGISRFAGREWASLNPGAQEWFREAARKLMERMRAADVPGADTGNAGGGAGPVQTAGAPAVDVGALADEVLRSDASPGQCGSIIGKVADLGRELETALRECARLRDELSRRTSL
jgi:hypothetical protein